MNLIAALALTLCAQDRPNVDIVFCVDRSGSMQQVIDTAKRKVWTIVNEVARAKPAPALRIGLIGYGSADKEFKFFPLSSDLDKVYEDLMTFKTDMGGDEWVGAALRKAANEMAWATGKKDVRIIFMVGNETAAQGTAENMYTVTAPEAIKKDITVNAIYCGNPKADEERTWREVASLADGQYTVIDLSGGAVTIATPFDKELGELSGKLNGTYVGFGRRGAEGLQRQAEADRKSVASGGAPTAAARALSKSSNGYDNRAWDLVDASKDKAFKLEEVKEEDLPAEMKAMKPEERKAHLEAKTKEREELQKKIAQLSVERQKFIDTEMKEKGLDSNKAFDEAVKKAVREQSEKKGLQFEK
ncbi:MAG TPA: VWA domain-containing protein [Planctomycetota bacterium]